VSKLAIFTVSKGVGWNTAITRTAVVSLYATQRNYESVVPARERQISLVPLRTFTRMDTATIPLLRA
jgi:hypothetical protein